jgi:hypothetical protein
MADALPAHITPDKVVETAVKLMRSLSYRRAQQDARARQLKGRDAGAWADHAANVYRHDLLRALTKVEETECA